MQTNSDVQVLNNIRDIPKVKGRAMLIVPLALIVSLFFLWGIANNLNDILITQFKKLFSLSDVQSGLVQSAFYFGYFCLARKRVESDLSINRK